MTVPVISMDEFRGKIETLSYNVGVLHKLTNRQYLSDYTWQDIASVRSYIAAIKINIETAEAELNETLRAADPTRSKK